MRSHPTIVIWKGCDSTVSEAIEQFRDRWGPYSTASRHYPIVQLIQEVIDPAVAAYAATLPQNYCGYIPGAGKTGLGFSGVIRLVGLDAMVRLQRQLLGQFIATEDSKTAKDQRFIATLESLIGLVWDCGLKRPAKSKVRDTQLNGERLRGFCRFCGSLAELASFANGCEDSKADDPEEKLRLSSRYCKDHRPKLPSGVWNPEYRKAKRSVAQFDLELGRLRWQCAHPRSPQAKSGDQLVDRYFFQYLAALALTPADKEDLRNQARLMVDSKLSDRKKQMLLLQSLGLNQSEIARKLGIKRQAVSKALASIPEMFRLTS